MSLYLECPSFLTCSNSPVVFLAGPIQGTSNWQLKAAKLLEKNDADFVVASPRRAVFENVDYDEQVNWESWFLRRAGQRGIVVFWLANEEDHMCERAYAQTTRFELAEMAMRSKAFGENVIVGIDSNFSNKRYIEKRLTEDYPNIPIVHSLEDTCNLTLQTLSKKYATHI